MEKETLNTAIAKLLPEVLQNAERVREMNKKAPVSGKRYTIPLEGRNIDIAYYSAHSENAPLFIGLHGGGFLMGGSCLDDDLWVNVRDMLDVNIASIDYRMSPAVMDFDPLYDAYDSALYLIDHADEFGFDKDHISVFGSSAGGNLAAAFAILAGRRKNIRLDNQILMYPFLDGFTDPDEKGQGSFSGVMPHIMNRLHFSPELADDPLLSPLYASKEDLTGLPKAIVSYCENDNLRPEAEQYCRNLREAGVETAAFLAEKMPHGYIESGFKKMISVIDKQFLGENADELIKSGLLRDTSVRTIEFVKAEMIR